MQTLIIEAENSKIQALTAFLLAFEIKYRFENIKDIDTTEYLLSNPANKKRILESIQQLNNGQTEAHNLLDI